MDSVVVVDCIACPEVHCMAHKSSTLAAVKMQSQAGAWFAARESGLTFSAVLGQLAPAPFLHGLIMFPVDSVGTL